MLSGMLTRALAAYRSAVADGCVPRGERGEGRPAMTVASEALAAAEGITPEAARSRIRHAIAADVARRSAPPAQEYEDAPCAPGMPGDHDHHIRWAVAAAEELEVLLSSTRRALRETYARARDEGLDVRVLRRIVKLRSRRADQYDETLAAYMRALGE